MFFHWLFGFLNDIRVIHYIYQQLLMKKKSLLELINCYAVSLFYTNNLLKLIGDFNCGIKIRNSS